MTAATFTLSPVSWMKRRKSHRRTQSEVLPKRPRVNHDPAAAAPRDSLDSPFLDTSTLRPLQPMASLPESPVSDQLQQQQNLAQQAQQLQQASEQPPAPIAQQATGSDATVPPLLQQGVPMLKVSAKKQKRYVFKLDPDQGQIVWESKKLRYSE